ncbi:MAG: Flp pilus assembly complex ATPase component TadA [Bacilli bacterium]|nr:Flp pilus assembly complex ATPase component TadA [Bacilli bacterium]
MNENIFDKLDFGPFRPLLDDDDITDISYDNNGQIWVRSLTQGSKRVEIEEATPEFVEKLAFQCSNVMGTTFNNAKPFLDAESAELRMNFVHQSIATNGIALVIRKTPAKIRLEKDKLIQEDYFTPAIHDFLIKCVEGHCNIMVAGETGSGKTEFVKYLASHTKHEEKIITIEDTLELHLDKIFPDRDIVSMKTNNVASYSDVLVTCMRQNPKWILLSEVRSAEAVSAVRNSISSGHNILSTIHADKASAIPYRLYSLMETDLDVHQFLTTIYRYIQLGVHIKAFYSKQYGKFHRELDEVAEFYVDDNNVPKSRIIYQKVMGHTMMCKPSAHLVEYLSNQNIDVQDIIKDLPDDLPIVDGHVDLEQYKAMNGITDDLPAGNTDVQQEQTVEATQEVATPEVQAVPQEVAPEVPVQEVAPVEQVVPAEVVPQEVVQPVAEAQPVVQPVVQEAVPAEQVVPTEVVPQEVVQTVVEAQPVVQAVPQEVPQQVVQPVIEAQPVVQAVPQEMVMPTVVQPVVEAAPQVQPIAPPAVPTENGLPIVNPIPSAPAVAAVPGVVA